MSIVIETQVGNGNRTKVAALPDDRFLVEYKPASGPDAGKIFLGAITREDVRGILASMDVIEGRYNAVSTQCITPMDDYYPR